MPVLIFDPRRKSTRSLGNQVTKGRRQALCRANKACLHVCFGLKSYWDRILTFSFAGRFALLVNSCSKGAVSSCDLSGKSLKSTFSVASKRGSSDIRDNGPSHMSGQWPLRSIYIFLFYPGLSLSSWYLFKPYSLMTPTTSK